MSRGPGSDPGPTPVAEPSLLGESSEAARPRERDRPLSERKAKRATRECRVVAEPSLLGESSEAARPRAQEEGGPRGKHGFPREASSSASAEERCGMPKVGIEPTLPGGNRILSGSETTKLSG